VTSTGTLWPSVQVGSWQKQQGRAASKRDRLSLAMETSGAGAGGAHEEGGGGKKQRTSNNDSAGGSGGGGGGGGSEPLTTTEPGLLQQVLATVAALGGDGGDSTMLDAFVTQLAPDVLADVVLSNMAHLSSVAGVVDGVWMTDAGSAGSDGFVEAAMAAHEARLAGVAGPGPVEWGAGPGAGVGGGGGGIGGDGGSGGGGGGGGAGGGGQEIVDLMDDGKEDEAVASAAAAAPLAVAQPSTVAAAAAAAQPPTAVAPFRLTVQAMSGAQRRGQSSAALARIVRAADPSGAVASMGGAALQAALLSRLAASTVAAAVLTDGALATGPVGGVVPASSGGGEGVGGGSVPLTVELGIHCSPRHSMQCN